MLLLYLPPQAVQQATPDYLFEEIRRRLDSGPARMQINVQIAAPEDVTDDSTIHWPADRARIPFGTVELLSVVPDDAAAQRHIIFDPIPRVNGIEPSGDPLLEPRATTYLISGRRRRAATPVQD
jgi:catalase